MGWFILAHFFSTMLAFVGLGRGSEANKDLEILILRHQLNIVARKQQKPIKPTRPDKLILAVLVHKLKRHTHHSTGLRFLIHDNDTKFTSKFDAIFETEDFHVIHTPCLAPNANAHAERWVRSVREECLDLILILNSTHLRRVLREHIDDYYNVARPHQGLAQKIPQPPPAQNNQGPVRRRPVLGGLINDYYRSSENSTAYPN